MKRARVRFYAELNDFLEPAARGGAVVHSFSGRPAVKDMIESLGVPHTEVDLIVIAGEAVPFEYQVEDGDRISVYPTFRRLEPGADQRLQPVPLPEPRFILDIHLGQLTNYLRMLGFDCLYRNDFADEELAELSWQEDRILLTRDRELLKRGRVRRGYYLRSTVPREQVVEVGRRFRLLEASEPFRRCIRCNGLLKSVDRDDVEGEIPPDAGRHYRHFRRCPTCHKVYWDGSHVERMRALIDWIGSQLTGNTLH